MIQAPISPLLLFRSFLTVISSFIAAQVLFLGAAVVIGYFFFPDFYQALFLAPEEREAILEEEPLKILPPWSMFLATVLVTGIAYGGLGWLIVRLSPFAHFLHAVFVALLVIIWFAQSYLEGSIPQKRTMDLFYLILLPIPLLWVAHASARSIGESNVPFEEEWDAKQRGSDQGPAGDE